MSRTATPTSRRVAAVERALVLLETLASAESAELGTNELARRTGLHPSSASRLLATLAAAGLVERVSASGRYRLGLGLLRLGNAVLARLDVREVARPHLRALAATTGETATISAPGGRDAVTVDFVQSAASVQSVAQVGRESVGHATATGKVLLAFGDVELPRGPLAAFTARTITDPAALAAELERVRERGLARPASARTTSTRWPRPSSATAASSPPSSASRARPPASARRRWRARRRRSSPVHRPSRTL